MKTKLLILVLLLVSTATVTAQDATTRAWQQRLQIDVPLPVPVVKLEAVNPFARQIDELPVITSSSAPSKLPVQGNAAVAVNVDPKGACLGAVSLHAPFPALASTLHEECSSGRFEAASIGGNPVPAWGVVEITLAGKVKESSVLSQQLDLPEETRPPVPAPPNRTYPSGRQISLPATDPASLTTPIAPKRLRVRVASREQDVPMRALVHITADGRCDRFVPLEVDTGLNPWLSAFLATWRLQPARFQGEAMDCWLIYTARVHLRLSSIESTHLRVLANRPYDPAQDTPPAE